MYSTFFIAFEKDETINNPEKEPLLVHANNQLRLKTIGWWDRTSQEHKALVTAAIPSVEP